MAPSCLKQAFTPADLAPLLFEAGINATVLVQAAPEVAETDYLLGIADATPSVAGVIGWVDFDSDKGRADFDRLAKNPRLLGLRPMVQDIEDDDWVLRPEIEWAFTALQERNLVFEALGYPRHAPRFLTLCERHPYLKVVIDHGMKPAIARNEFTQWASDMSALARNTGAYCKLSGLATEAAPNVTPEDLRPYVEHLVDVFGPKRLMWGSDWPVSTSAIGYLSWLRACETLLKPLSDEGKRLIFGETATKFYQLISGVNGIVQVTCNPLLTEPRWGKR